MKEGVFLHGTPKRETVVSFLAAVLEAVADPGERGTWPPGPVKISHKKDGHQRRPHRFHVSQPPLPSSWIHYWLEVKFFIHIYEKYLIDSVVCRNHYWLLCERSRVSSTQLVNISSGSGGARRPWPPPPAL